jgi:pimeloyl-[acyl-carrier protein] methyl ester esterase
MEYLRDQSLILMPGLDGTGLSFEPLLKIIPDNVKITIIHYPIDKLLSFEETVECAAAQIVPEPPPIVIAESFSGPVAVQMIASGRIKAKALILCATFAKSPHPIIWTVTRFLRLPRLIRPEMPVLFFKIILGDKKLIASLLPLWKKVHADVPARVMDHRLGLINRVDVTESLKKLSLPCLYLQAMDDRVVSSSCLKYFEQNIPHLVIKRIKAPHFILQAKPQECLEAIEQFISLIN